MKRTAPASEIDPTGAFERAYAETAGVPIDAVHRPKGNAMTGKTDELLRPIVGVENRTAQEVFDIMCDRIAAWNRRTAQPAVKALLETLETTAQRLKNAEWEDGASSDHVRRVLREGADVCNAAIAALVSAPADPAPAPADVVEATKGRSTDWVNFRQLSEGEIIEAGDEVLTDAHLGWRPAGSTVGQTAPNPNYTAHRMYRRALSTPRTALSAQGWRTPGEFQELHIIFQDDGGPANLRFVEVETPDGKSVRAGTWLKRDGYDVLALTVHKSDLPAAPSEGHAALDPKGLEAAKAAIAYVCREKDIADAITAYLAATTPAATLIEALASRSPNEMLERRFEIGERVTKIKGSSWTGRIVGFYATALTPIGYCVESENEPGSVQIYPEAAIRAMKEPENG